MDLLSTVLLSLRLIDSSIGLFEFAPPWGFRMDAMSREHVFVFGPQNHPVHLKLEGESAQLLQPGDTAMVQGAPFTLQSSPQARLESLEQFCDEHGLPRLGPQAARSGPARLCWPVGAPAAQQQEASRIVTMALLVEDVAQNPVLGVLPRCVVLRGGTVPLYPWCEPVQRFIEFESQRTNPGYQAASRLLAQLTFVEITRAHAVVHGVAQASWLKGITDPQIGRALGLIYGEPQRDWRLETLAAACGMARSTLSRRFLELVGTTPMAHLGALRLHEAARRLANGERVGAVAAAIGYQSEWAFRRAFSQQFGGTPTQYRQAQRR